MIAVILEIKYEGRPDPDPKQIIPVAIMKMKEMRGRRIVNMYSPVNFQNSRKLSHNTFLFPPPFA